MVSAALFVSLICRRVIFRVASCVSPSSCVHVCGSHTLPGNILSLSQHSYSSADAIAPTCTFTHHHHHHHHHQILSQPDQANAGASRPSAEASLLVRCDARGGHRHLVAGVESCRPDVREAATGQEGWSECRVIYGGEYWVWLPRLT